MEIVGLPCKSCPSEHKFMLVASGHTRTSKNVSKRNMNTRTHLLTCHSHTENCGKEPAGESDYSATVTITATRWTNQWPTCFNAKRACFISNSRHVFDNTTLVAHLSKTANDTNFLADYGGEVTVFLTRWSAFVRFLWIHVGYVVNPILDGKVTAERWTSLWVVNTFKIFSCKTIHVYFPENVEA